ncbi:hypothetical protein [Heliomarina baculiformis]|uniref:hypothetical protein n=1 Tax=Heliomarina baculiformis TaxID=2872036 RepID=UPI001EE1E36A|nr:hypothetical protein [Heliomarina baculiformis]
MHHTSPLFLPGSYLAPPSAMVVGVFAALQASGQYASEGRNLLRDERSAAFSPDGRVIHGSR